MDSLFRDAVSDYVQDYASDPEDDEGFEGLEGLEGFEEQGSLQELEESSSEILGDAPLFEDHVPDLLSINLESSLEATIAKRKAAFQARLTPQKYRDRRQRPQNGHSLNPASPLPPVYSPLRRSGNRKDHGGNDTSDNNLFVHGSAQPNGPDKPPSWIVHKCAQLEAQIRKLRRENQEWVNRFRSEARTRATVMNLRRTVQTSERQQADLGRMLQHAEDQAHEAEIRVRRAKTEASQWKQLADEKHVDNFESSKIEDMLWKPKFDALTTAHEALNNNHDTLRNAFENLFEDYLDMTSKAARKFRGKAAKATVDAAVKKNAGSGKNKLKPPPAKKRPRKKSGKKKGKFGAALVMNASRERREEFIANRKKKMSVHICDLVHDHRSFHVTESDMPAWIAKDQEHHVQVLSLASPIVSIVPLPLAKYKPGTAPKEIRVAYVDYDRLISLIGLTYRAAMSQRLGSDIDPSLETTNEIGGYIGRMRTLADVFREQMTQKYGVLTAVEGYMYGVVEALLRFQANSIHVEYFGRMVGVIDPDLYSPRLGAMFFRLLRTIVDEDRAVELLTCVEPEMAELQAAKAAKYAHAVLERTKRDQARAKEAADRARADQQREAKGIELSEIEKAARNLDASIRSDQSQADEDDLGPVVLPPEVITAPLARCLQAVDTVFPPPGKRDFMLAWAKLGIDDELREKLVKTLRRLSVPAAQTMVLDVNLLLACCVDAWITQNETDIDRLRKLWRKRQLKEDKALDFRVFADAVKSCSAAVAGTKDGARPPLPNNLIYAMWLQVLGTNDTGTDFAVRDGFAVVCSAHGVVPPPPPPEETPGDDTKKGKKGKKKAGKS
eukprot:g3309.t1